MEKVECPLPNALIHRVQLIHIPLMIKQGETRHGRQSREDAQPTADRGGVESSGAYQK